MKGKYVFDVKNVPTINVLVRKKARELGVQHPELDEASTPRDECLLFIDLDNGTLKASELSWGDYERKYGFGQFERGLSVIDFLRLEKPVPQVALALVITDDLSKIDGTPRLVTKEDMAEFDFAVTRDHVMEAAETACSALGV